MGLFDDIKGGLGAVGGAAKSAVSSVIGSVPDAVKEPLFGGTNPPPTPTTPEAAQGLIDNVIGHQPHDAEIAKNIDGLTKSVQVDTLLDQATGGLFTGMPFDPQTRAKLATGSITDVPDSHMLANVQLQQYFKEQPRAQELYLRNYDPLNKDLLPYVVQANAKSHPGFLGNAVSKFTDVTGFTIGNTLDMLSKPSREVETWYGSHFVFNDISDASLRQAMARQSYAYTLNLADPHYIQLDKARNEAQHIEQDLGLKGPAAAGEYERWLREDGGNPGLAAHFADAAGQMVADPLWLVPTGAFGEVAKAASKAVTGTDDVTRLFRLAGEGRKLIGDNTVREVLQMPELDYRLGTIRPPSSRGPLTWLWDTRAPQLADQVHDSTLRFLTGPLQRATTLNDKLEVLARYRDVFQTGKMDDRALELFSGALREDKAFAQTATLAKDEIPRLIAESPKRNYVTDITQGIMEGLEKNPEIAALQTNAPDELNRLLLENVAGNSWAIAADGQAAKFPQWFRNRWMPLVNKQKQVLSLFSLDRPSMAVNVMASNMLHYFWTVARHPLDIGGESAAAKTFAHAFGAEMRAGDQALPAEFSNIASALGLNDETAFKLASSSTYLHEAQGQPYRAAAHRLDTISDLDDATAKATKALTKPVTDMVAGQGWTRYIKWPLTLASRNDRAIRTATFFHSANEQLNLAMSPGRLIDALFPNVRDNLVETGMPVRDAERWEGHILDSVRSWVMTPGNSMADADGLRKVVSEAAARLTANTPSSMVSPYDMFVQFARSRGVADEAIPFMAKDYEPVFQRLHRDILAGIDENTPLNDVYAKISQMDHAYWSFDQAIAHATQTNPILRPTTDYSATLARDMGGIANLDEAMRTDLTDTAKHVDRYLATLFPDWHGANELRVEATKAASDMVHGRLTRLADIAKNKVEKLANPAHDWNEAQAWNDYWQFTGDSLDKYHATARGIVSGLNEEAAAPLDMWHTLEQKVMETHQKILARARETGATAADPAATWRRAANDVADLFNQSANSRAAIFGVDPNEAVQAIDHLRPGAPQTQTISEYLNFIKDNIGPDIARLRSAEPIQFAARTPSAVLADVANDVAKRGPDVAQRAFSNAMYKTDLVRSNYNKQTGLDGLLQMFSPFEYFGTRTAMNTLIRTMRMPGATAMLAQAILLPQEYAQQYGYNKGAGKIPIPIPGLQDFLRRLPYVGSRIKNADFGNVYWADPLDMMFPMTRFLNNYDDQAKTATPGGLVANWFEKNTPLGISPFAKIIGSVSGILPRDAWSNSLFQGGPFGIPLSTAGQAAARWLQLGDGSGVPPTEQANYATHGVFSWSYLGEILGISNQNQFDQYRAERSLASLVATGKITSDDAWVALHDHKGNAWNMATKEMDSAKFLQDFTGAVGFRLEGTTKGQSILMGERALYSKAAASGQLTEFFNKYPEYQVDKVAVKGLTDPKARQQEIDTQIYYNLTAKYVDQPYQQSLDELSSRINDIRARSNITETDEQQIKFYEKQISDIKDQQSGIRKMIENVTPNRTTDHSIHTPPQERALMGVADRWYAIQQQPGEAYADFQARQKEFLSSFPAATKDTGNQWTTLTQDFLSTSMKFNLSISLAAQDGQWSQVDDLVKQRDKALNDIHQQAADNVSQQDVLQYLSLQSRRLSPQEIEFNEAHSLYDMWMSYVSTGSPLSAAQKSAVSAFFSSLPIMQKHYNAATIDLRNLNEAGHLALAHRRDVLKQYNSLTSVDAQIDYMKQHEADLNIANQWLGLPPMSVLDLRPPPPEVPTTDPYAALLGFSGKKNIVDELLAANRGNVPRGTQVQAAGESDPGSALPLADQSNLIDASVGRGY